MDTEKRQLDKDSVFYPPEWYVQDRVEMAWPDVHTDWNPILDEVQECYVFIVKRIMKIIPVILLCTDKDSLLRHFKAVDSQRLIPVEVPYNDTWARDFGGITVFKNGKPQIYDFSFNGWGLKFAAGHDNYTNRFLKQKGIFDSVELIDKKNVVLEGGSIESDGEGTLMTTTSCLLSEHRNDEYSLQQMTDVLKENFGVSNIIWLHNGGLIGDDTDGHIDTLARFAPNRRIIYCKCYDANDVHFETLNRMEEELKAATDYKGEPYDLFPVPIPSAIFDDGERLPATYVNYLIVNKHVLVPVYGVKEDQQALDMIEQAHPGYKIIAINCVPLIKQHGSLHCITMNYPKGVFN